ncbi:hypothetical protein C7445_12312 [Alicyclobacillus sacchari]|uniref:Uncharacterized protein n=1 Tax=Alicyclobacillus sacchari TaxID=392010 RepID=A0A4R8LBG8_9BACL|nr:hypothetical protein [Alicyclobacillus sacchari]TDY40241.1 hypothetical protein C7445_12312 [Alicyclobacillus sacchari]GMA59374.1 hypothetical protein GCM10025858_38770 [Alicyclobacillus sacchari]
MGAVMADIQAGDTFKYVEGNHETPYGLCKRFSWDGGHYGNFTSGGFDHARTTDSIQKEQEYHG